MEIIQAKAQDKGVLLMSNALYDKAREKFLNGDLSWRDNTVKAVLVDAAGYTVNLAIHEFLSDVTESCRISTSGAFASKTATAGIADALDVTFTSVPAGNACEAIIIFVDTGNQLTSSLIAYIDTATGLPITPVGGNIIITWSNGSEKIFKL